LHVRWGELRAVRFFRAPKETTQEPAGTGRVLPSIPGEKMYMGNDYRLTFTKYGDTYFISKVQAGVAEATMRKSRAERKMAALQGTKVPVVASLMK
jgi:hypothetical protein